MEFDDMENFLEAVAPGGSTEWVSFLLRFAVNFLAVGILIHCLYYPKSRRRDYYFTFMLVNIFTFMLIFMLGSVKVKVGFALGIFAIFGIIRYRTETVPIREMTYLFAITALSVINGLALWSGLLIVANVLMLLVVFALEKLKWLNHTSCKLIMYDRIELILPERRGELLDDLKKRTGLEISRVEIGHIDFLKDAAMLKIYYASNPGEESTVDNIVKLPKE